MRTLLIAPVLHISVEMDTIQRLATKKGNSSLGTKLSEQHRQTISGYWENLSNCLKEIPIEGLKIYQDGMPTDGDAAKQITEEAVKNGSENYRIVAELLGRGAEIMLTEDFQLVKREKELLLGFSGSSNAIKKLGVYLKYWFRKKSLMKKRDEFIANRINKTLDGDEKGILFIGVTHNLISRLPQDLNVIPLKDFRRIAGYQKSVLRAAISSYASNDFYSLCEYLTEPIKLDSKLCPN